MKSMTGYGEASGTIDGINYQIQIKSVNNRFLDTYIRCPRSLFFLEQEIKNKVREKVARGKVDIYFNTEPTENAEYEISINKGLFSHFLEESKSISDLNGLDFDADAIRILKLPEMMSIRPKATSEDVLSKGILELFSYALDCFNLMREREGLALKNDIEARLDSIEELLIEVEKHSAETETIYRDRLLKKITETLSLELDENRLMMELAIYADKVAIDEEAVRLRSHINQMRDFLKSGEAVGRKMDFLIQEFNREANTIGSKCQNADVSKLVVEIKTEIEKIREQVQNVE